MKRSIPTLLVVLALVLAGCNGFTFGGDGTPTETVTPAAVPTDEPTPTPVPQLAPGLTGQGVTDAFALGEAHATVLNNTSFTIHDETTVRFSNGTTDRHTEIDGQVVANRTRYDVVSNRIGVFLDVSRFRIELWANGTRVLRARNIDGNTSYRVERGLNRESIPPRQVYESYFGSGLGTGQAIYTVFGAVETRVVGETTRNGTTLYEVAAINVTDPNAFSSTTGVNPSRNVSFRAFITPMGLVREYSFSYTGTLGGEGVPGATGRTVHVRRAVRYSGLGNTTVERPPWYDEAIANVSTPTPTTSTAATRESALGFDR